MQTRKEHTSSGTVTVNDYERVDTKYWEERWRRITNNE